MSEWELRDWADRERAASEHAAQELLKKERMAREHAEVWKQIWVEGDQYRRSKGFVPATWETACTRIACISSEIYELEAALTNWNKWEPGSSPSSFETCSAACETRREFADIVLYILGLQSDLGFELGTIRGTYYQVSARFASPADFTKPLRREWNQVFKAWRNHNEKDLFQCFQVLLSCTVQLRRNLFGEDEQLSGVKADCLEKLAFMRNRPVLHGGKDPTT